MNSISYFFISLILTLSQNVVAQTSDQSVLNYLQTQWAVNNYQLSGEEQDKAFLILIEKANTIVETNPDKAPLLIWRGIIESTYAGIKGGLGALKWVRAAKDDLEQALVLEPQALEGSAYTSLGTLYFKVPGWPISFGDDEKAEQLLKAALQINPDGIDPNYFYAEYLRNEKRYQESYTHFRKALRAPPREGRELADQGRKKEIADALEDVNQHLS